MCVSLRWNSEAGYTKTAQSLQGKQRYSVLSVTLEKAIRPFADKLLYLHFSHKFS